MNRDNITHLYNMLKSFQIIDLSHTLQENIPAYPTHSKFYHLPWDSPDDPAVMYQILFHEHSGTHVDAPLHLIREKNINLDEYGMDTVPVDSLIGHCVTLHLSYIQPNQVVTGSMIREWERKNGTIEKGDIVIFNFGWWKKWRLIPEGYEVTKNWPGLGREAAEYLVEKRVKAVGTDCMALDSYPNCINGTAPAHEVLLIRRVLIMENLNNLDSLPPCCFFMAFPLKIKRGSASPIRAVALVPRD